MLFEKLRMKHRLQRPSVPEDKVPLHGTRALSRMSPQGRETTRAFERGLRGLEWSTALDPLFHSSRVTIGGVRKDYEERALIRSKP